MKELDLSNYYLTQVVAERLSVTTDRIVQLIKEGRLKGQKIGNKVWIVEKQSADDYIDAVTKVRG